ncbi:MAG: apolipoprotein N-acyltransferase [Spirochaetales bacterium]|nr:apolipoprotein N-acyltransferase [Spirochaetales bacterium]
MELSLLFLSSILFALSFPSFISVWGWFPLAFISLAPVFIVIHRSSWPKILLYGILYGYVSYALFNYWASTFHPLAIIILPTVYAVYFFLVFPLLKLCDRLLPRYGYLLQLLVWIAYEYLRTIGFLGYPYGIMGYSQYLFLPLIQISEITGVWGVSFLVVFPSVYLGHALKNGISGFREFIRRHPVSPAVYGLLFCACLVFGFFAESDYSDEPRARVALIQHNADTWEGGVDAYERNLKTLIRLSRESLKENPDIVIWSETAFVPGVDWHSRYRTDQRRYQLVKEFIDFMTTQNIPYVTGNDDGQLERNEEGELERVDYNAVLLYYQGELKKTYRKTHLVPFTENFPYKKQFPKFYQFLVDHEYHFWKKGEEYTVFQGPDFRFSTPICFEDVFGYLSREFVLRGAQVIVNVTNDSWSGSEAAQMQHMAMAVFRSVENRRTLVRSANSGMTCTIEPSGRITALLDPFIEGYLVQDIPIFDGVTTWYTKAGDWLGIGSVFAGLAGIAAGVILSFLRRRKGKVN